MTPGELLNTLKARGVTLALNGDRLVIDAPVGTLNDELRTELRRHKLALIQQVAQPGLLDSIDADRRAAEVIAAAESELLALFDAWQQADNPDDPMWRQRWAELSIAAGLPCFETRQDKRGEYFQIDAGVAGWRAWATKH